MVFSPLRSHSTREGTASSCARRAALTVLGTWQVLSRSSLHSIICSQSRGLGEISRVRLLIRPPSSRAPGLGAGNVRGRSVLPESQVPSGINCFVVQLPLRPFRWSRAAVARSPSNSHSDNYTGFKLFTTLRPQSNFKINLRSDGELADLEWRAGPP